MTDNSKKLSELPQASNVASTDMVLVLRDPAGTPSTRTVTIDNFSNSFYIKSNPPATSTSNGVAGTITYDNTYFYVCTSNNIWVRTQLSTW